MSGNPDKKKSKMEGTTIVALKYKDGVIIAADCRITWGHKIFSDESKKIEELGSLSCIGSAGSLGDIQRLNEILDEFIPYFEDLLETDIFVDGHANIVKEVLRGNELEAWPILAGWDPYQEKSRIFLLEPNGATLEMERYASTGSGEDYALEVLRGRWSKDCSREKGIEIAVEAILRASQNDPGTCGPLLSPPLIKDITSEKIIDISEQTSFKIAWKKFMEEQMRKGNKSGLKKFLFDPKNKPASTLPKRKKKTKETEEKKDES